MFVKCDSYCVSQSMLYIEEIFWRFLFPLVLQILFFIYFLLTVLPVVLINYVLWIEQNKQIITRIIWFLLFYFFCVSFVLYIYLEGMWSYGSWIYNYLCNQCLSPLTLWVKIPLMARCTWYNIMLIKFVSDLWQIGGFLWVLRFSSPIKLTFTI